MSNSSRRAWRITRGALNLLLPVAETGWILRANKRMAASHAERLKRCLPDKAQEQTAASPTWEEAIAASGITPAVLDKRYCRWRTFWRVIFWMLLLPAAFMTGMGLHATDLPPATLQRLLILILCLLGGAGMSTLRALIASYRLWQLRGQRVSETEGGTFSDFLADKKGWGGVTGCALFRDV